ncbi:MAG: alpha/beta fold hydrolase [Actinomycetota bacterium]|jgi:polyhydroxyalkanoate synthase|nr:alpha/beta fold hydrolase [Actinomycetota bacterium]
MVSVTSVTRAPADLLNRVRQDAERSVLRARNGVKYVAGVDRPKVGVTPKQTVWRRDKVELWRYDSDDVRYRPPLLIVMSLISRSYILDLMPGNSLIEQLRDAGFDVYLLDWGIPDEREAQHTLETYVDDYLPRAVRKVAEVSGTDDVNVLGYCYGGILSLLLAARHPELPIRGLAVMAAPVDFDKMGLFNTVLERLDPEAIIDDSGNVPPDVIANSFKVLKPTTDLSTYATLWQNLWNDKQMEAFQAMGQWTRDHIPFPGKVFKQTVGLMRDNALVEDKVVLGGKPVHLSDIRCPFLNVMAENDHIVPGPSAAPVIDLVGSEDKSELKLQAGHVGLVASRQAKTKTIPKIAEWLVAHSEPVGASSESPAEAAEAAAARA